MPVIKRCCCCDLRGWCVAVGIFSVVVLTTAVGCFPYWSITQVTSLAWSAWGGYNLYESGILQTDSFSDVAPFYYGYAVGAGLWIFLSLASVTMIFGVCFDRRGMLIPYIVAGVLVILVHCALCALYLYVMIEVFNDGYVYDVFNLVALSTSGIFIVLDVLALLCVISRYQELRYGEDASVIRQQPPRVDP